MRYGRIVDNAVAEIVTPIEGFDIADCFAPAIVATLALITDDVQIGWVKQEDGSFAAPVVEEAVTPVVEETPVEETVTPAEPEPE
jgi:hypothetical protein